MTSPDLGLLLDVDGPIASTVTRTIRIPSIADDLVAMAHAGVPIVFNTGRSDAFLAEQVLPALCAAGLQAGDPVWGVCEKGAAWFGLSEGTAGPERGEVAHDPALRPPQALIDDCERLVARHADLMFWDDTKRTMISIEQRVDVQNDAYLARQPTIIGEAERLIRDHGAGDNFHIVPSVISVDVEHRSAGKALGAARAAALVSQRMPLPRRWYTAGDSRIDYDMASWLHDHGHEVGHLDVRPRDGVPEVPFEVIREAEDAPEDEITARHLRLWRRSLADVR